MQEISSNGHEIMKRIEVCYMQILMKFGTCDQGIDFYCSEKKYFIPDENFVEF